MKFFPAPPHSTFQRPPFCRPAAYERNINRLHRWPADSPPDEIVWSEAEGQLVDLALDTCAATHVPDVPDASKESPCRILIVDDDPILQKMLAEVLRRAGHHVQCAADGEAGWSALCTEVFDVAIIDHNIPQLTGLDLLRRMRANRKDMPVILISGDIPWNEAGLRQLLTPGMTLEKPFSLVELLAQVRSVSMAVSRAGEIRDGQPVLEFDVIRRAHWSHV